MLTVLGAAIGSSAIIIVPFDVTIVGGVALGRVDAPSAARASNFWRFGLEPSAAGHVGHGLLSAPLLVGVTALGDGRSIGRISSA